MDEERGTRRGEEGDGATGEAEEFRLPEPKVTSKYIQYEGSAFFRQRVLMSIVSGRVVKFINIRHNARDPGLKEHEIKFLRLVDMITDGTTIKINESGTRVTVRPGVIVNGRKLRFDCGETRAIGYYLEHLLFVAPFGKKPLHITFTGVTDSDDDPSCDVIRTVMLPLMQRFGVEDTVELKIKKRGCRALGDKPSGGGEVEFQCPTTRQLHPLMAFEPGKIKRIRGNVYTARVSATKSGQVIDGARSVLNKFIPDVFLYSNHYDGAKSGKAPGFGVSLVADTTQAFLISAQANGKPRQDPRELGKECAFLLLDEIRRGGCVDTQSQTLAFALMALCSQDVSKIRVGVISQYSAQFLRDLRTFFGVTFKLVRDTGSKAIFASCVGVGYNNIARKIT